jgi:hypothetical protein
MPVISTQGNIKLKTETRKTENTKKHLVPPLSRITVLSFSHPQLCFTLFYTGGFEILVLQEKISQPYGFSIDF